MDFGKYLKEKDGKLQEQRDRSTQSDIFAGTTIYITGHTEPSAAHLMELITAHGGRICNFFSSKNSATHIVAETLTARKSELWASYQVARPRWITESIAKGTRLPWTNFRTIQENISEEGWIMNERKHVNCLDKNFIQEYLKNSRLHFLSTRKRALRQKLNSCTGNHTPRDGPQTILHVDFDSFFVSAALKNRPDLAKKPVCTSHGSDSSDVASCNYIARSYGVKNGMWVSRARKLCPDLICLPYDFDAYRTYSDALYDTLQAIKPDYICPISIDEALVNVTNTLSSTGQSLDSLIDGIRETIKKKTGLSVSIGAGPNILLAKVAMRIAKPDGKHIFISEKDALGTLSDLSVDKVPSIGYITTNKLAQLGIHKISDVQRFKPSVLEYKIGPSVTQRLFDATLGQDSNDISTLNQPPKTIGVDIAWGVRTVSREEMHLFISSVVEELWTRLEADVESSSVSIKVYCQEKNAPFITPKYMGCGKCDIFNRTVQLEPGLVKQRLQGIVVETVDRLRINPLRFRGLGVHIRCSDGTKRTGTEYQDNQKRLNDYNNPPKTPQKKREFVTLQPTRGFMTLTQFSNRDTVDREVFDALPDDIKHEIAQHADLHNVRLSHGSKTPDPKRRKTKQEEAEEYYPINFLGKIRKESSIRAQVKLWVSLCKQGPFYEDALEFYRYIESVLKDDWNWLKAVSLANWLDFQISEQKSCLNWCYFSQLVQKLLDGSEMEADLPSSLQACTPTGSQESNV